MIAGRDVGRAQEGPSCQGPPSAYRCRKSHATEVAGWHHVHPRTCTCRIFAVSAEERAVRRRIGADLDRLLHRGRRRPRTGIGALRASPDGTLRWLGVAAAADSPSFLAVHPTLDVVYAVARDGADRPGVPPLRRIRSGARRPGLARRRRRLPCRRRPAGPLPCVACWGDGQVLLYELDGDGGISARFAAAASIVTGRPSRAHASLMLDDGRVMTTDLGHDLLRIWNYVALAGAATGPRTAPPPGLRPPAPRPASRRQRAGGDRILDRGGRGAALP